MKFYTAFLILVLTSCSNTPPLVLDSKNPIEVQYAFNDSSVPPEYHRSYIITIRETKIHVIVDSYGDVLADAIYPMNSVQFHLLIQKINEANLKSGRNTPNEPCDGGTSENLTIKESGVQVYNGYFDHCADEVPAEMGNIASVIDVIHTLAPTLGDMLK